MTGRRRCFTRKIRYFNEAWAQIAADEQSRDLGSVFRPYRCRCGWWHTYDRSKKRRKDAARETRNQRRARARLGETK